MSSTWMPPGAPEWQVVEQLLDSIADLIETEDFAQITHDLLPEGAHHIADLNDIDAAPSIQWIARQSAQQLVLAYLRSPWRDDQLVADIIDHIATHPRTVQITLARSAAAATRAHCRRYRR